MLGGKPLIAWSIECALKCTFLDRVIVSTDDDEIAAVAREFGAEVPFMRPDELARDTSPEWHVWQHTLRTLESIDGCLPGLLVTLPPTSPLRAVEDVEACIDALTNKGADACITVRPADRNPYFNMVTVTDGWAKTAINGAGRIDRRQDAPPVFDMTTVAYAVQSTFVLSAARLFEGKVCAVTVPPERAVDIDSELDFAFAEFMLTRRADERSV